MLFAMHLDFIFELSINIAANYSIKEIYRYYSFPYYYDLMNNYSRKAFLK